MQVLRALKPALSGNTVACLLSCLQQCLTIALDPTPHPATVTSLEVSLELLITLRAIVDASPANKLILHPQLLWVGVSLLGTHQVQLYGQGVQLLSSCLKQLQMGDPLVQNVLLAAAPVADPALLQPLLGVQPVGAGRVGGAKWGSGEGGEGGGTLKLLGGKVGSSSSSLTDRSGGFGGQAGKGSPIDQGLPSAAAAAGGGGGGGGGGSVLGTARGGNAAGRTSQQQQQQQTGVWAVGKLLPVTGQGGTLPTLLAAQQLLLKGLLMPESCYGSVKLLTQLTGQLASSSHCAQLYGEESYGVSSPVLLDVGDEGAANAAGGWGGHSTRNSSSRSLGQGAGGIYGIGGVRKSGSFSALGPEGVAAAGRGGRGGGFHRRQMSSPVRSSGSWYVQSMRDGDGRSVHGRMTHSVAAADIGELLEAEEGQEGDGQGQQQLQQLLPTAVVGPEGVSQSAPDLRGLAVRLSGNSSRSLGQSVSVVRGSGGGSGAPSKTGEGDRPVGLEQVKLGIRSSSEPLRDQRGYEQQSPLGAATLAADTGSPGKRDRLGGRPPRSPARGGRRGWGSRAATTAARGGLRVGSMEASTWGGSWRDTWGQAGRRRLPGSRRVYQALLGDVAAQLLVTLIGVVPLLAAQLGVIQAGDPLAGALQVRGCLGWRRENSGLRQELHAKTAFAEDLAEPVRIRWHTADGRARLE